MKKSRFKDDQIAFALRQAEAGASTVEVCRKTSVSEQASYRWKKLWSGMCAAELRRLNQLEEENRKLKTLFAYKSLNMQILQDARATPTGALQVYEERSGGASKTDSVVSHCFNHEERTLMISNQHDEYLNQCVRYH